MRTNGDHDRPHLAGRLSRPGLLLCSLLLSACLAGTVNNLSQSISDAVAPKVTFLVQARNAEAGALRSVVIVTDYTEVAQQIGLGLESSMNKLRIEERPHFSTVKLGPRANGQLSDGQMAALAREAGVEAVVSVLAGASDVEHANSREDRYSCAAETKLFKACPKGQSRTSQVSCTTATGAAAARLRVYRAADGKSVFADTITGGSQAYRCVDHTTPEISTRQLAYGAVVNTTENIMRIMAPSFEQAPLDLMRADAAISAAQQKTFDAATDFAQAKRMDEACHRFGELYEDNKDSPALTFNVAFCHELRGDLLRANQGYKRASELVNAPHAQIDRRLTASEKALRENPHAFMPGTDTTGMAKSPVLVGNGKRVALVIGNARYQRSALINPVNDARLVGDRLKKIGFDVVIVENLDAARFGTVIRDFASRAKNADIALFYYAGHALQAEGENYLMPVDNAKMRSMEDVRDGGGVQLASVVAQLDVAAPRVKLLVLDACRDNPLPASGRSLAGGGLAAIKQAPQGGFIAFATSPGRTAEDGTGKNSVFSKHFARQMLVPNQTVEQLFKRVRESVKAETRNRQEPTEISSLIGEVMLVKGI